MYLVGKYNEMRYELLVLGIVFLLSALYFYVLRNDSVYRLFGPSGDDA